MKRFEKHVFAEFSPDTASRKLLSLINSLDNPEINSAQRAERLQLLHDYLVALKQSNHETLRELSKVDLPPHTDNDRWLHLKGRLLAMLETVAETAVADADFLVTHSDGEPAIREQLPFVLVLDSLRSAFNVGAIFRTAECMGANKLYLCGYTPTPQNKAVRKAAMGADEVVEWQHEAHITAVLEHLRQEKYQLIAMETSETATPLASVRFAKPCAILVGNEQFGLDSSLLNRVDLVARIPMQGIKNSLNVGAALAMTAYEINRQWTGQQEN